MENKILAPLFVALLTFSAVGQADPIKVEEKDTLKKVLAHKEDQRVTLMLKSGNELSGKLIEVNEDVVHLGELTGKEYYDAVIDTHSIEAVVIRVK